jgi:hypothetical protein
LAALAIAGCGGGSSGVGSGGPVPLDQSAGQWAQVICTQNFKCASKADIGDNNMQGCIMADTMGWQSLIQPVQTDQPKGRVAYDPAVMGMCLATLSRETCAEWTSGLTHDEWCREAFTPMVAVGGACLSDVECVRGYCDGVDTSKTPPVEGACKPSIIDGQACDGTYRCVDTDYCDLTAMTCVPKKAGGTACDSDEQCSYEHCTPATNQCTGYAGCSVAPVTRASTFLSLVGLGLVVAAARRRRSTCAAPQRRRSTCAAPQRRRST